METSKRSPGFWWFDKDDVCRPCAVWKDRGYGRGTPPGKPIFLTDDQIECWRFREEDECRKSTS